MSNNQPDHHQTTPATAPSPNWTPATDEETKRIAPYVKAVREILKTPPFTEPDRLPVQLLPWLHLSDMYGARNVSMLIELGITHVLTTNETRQWEMEEYYLPSFARCSVEHHVEQGQDESGYDMIGRHWPACREFMEQARSRNNRDARIVVHCAAGQNRSGLIAAAALLLLNDHVVDDDGSSFLPQGAGLLDVVRYLKAKRGIVLNNESFQEQLCLLALRENRLESRVETK